MTREEFLAWAANQELRYEFNGFAPIAMTGGTVAHSAIEHNLHLSIGGRLRGKPCRFHGSNLKVQTARGCRYPARRPAAERDHRRSCAHQCALHPCAV